MHARHMMGLRRPTEKVDGWKLIKSITRIFFDTSYLNRAVAQPIPHTRTPLAPEPVSNFWGESPDEHARRARLEDG
jgi:hypothetical protein